MNAQMELGFTNSTPARKEMRRQSRLQRARWWFNQMRLVVDQALDRNPRPPARPEQIYFVLRRNA